MKAPYLIVAFDVDPADPQADAIIKDAQDDFPLPAAPITLGVENVWLVEVADGQKIQRLNQINNYLAAKDTGCGGRLRWIVQLCRSKEVGTG